MGRSSKDEPKTGAAVRTKSLSALPLPPGLYNLGNSCFFNSVFQSLLATQAIEALVRDGAGTPGASRSPALCNGRPGGAPHDKRLPVSDTFLRMTEAAWNAQDHHLRQSMSLRELLMKLGQKYDQYLDFRQQDAHELLRHLLDAISTEETDIIRERNPRPKKRRKHQHQHEQQQTPEAEQPASFIDLAFGGTLASILVCAECKHVSVTHEPFYDLSLSLHTEAGRERKRDKLASLANKIQNIQIITKKPSTRKARPVSQPPPPKSSSADLAQSTSTTKRGRDTPTLGLPGGSESSSSGGGGIGRFFRWTKSPERSTVEPALATAGTLSRPGTPKTLSARSSAEFTVPPKLLKRHSSSSRPTSRTASPRPSTDRDRDRDDSPAAAAPRSASAMPRSPLKELSALPDDEPASTSTPTARRPTFAPRSKKKVQEAYTKALLAHPAGPDGGDSETLLDALRAFTAVERLDGDNRIGCRTCWKKKHGTYDSDASSSSSSESDSSESEDEEEQVKAGQTLLTRPSLLLRGSSIHHRASASVASLPSELPGAQAQEDGEDGDGEMLEVGDPMMHGSVKSLPARPSTLLVRSASAVDVPSAGDVPDNPYRGPIPSIQTTAPEAEADRPSKHRRESAFGGREVSSPGYYSASSSSSRGPSPRRTATMSSDPSPRRHGTMSSEASTTLGRDGGDASDSASGSGSPAAITLTITDEPDMVLVDVPSSTGTPAATPTPIASTAGHMMPAAPDAGSLPSPASSVASLESRASSSRKPRKPKLSSKERAKQVVRTPTLKRYLIAHAPPVLVLHLKRFQQVSSSDSSSSSSSKSAKAAAKLWSSSGVGGGGGMDGWNRAFGHAGSTLAGFRKVDEWIEFPEVLDIGAFVMPRKEDLVEPSRENVAARLAEGSKYVYRLYAVVVHIGNILGGHYVAYTALPPDPRRPAKAEPASVPSAPAPTPTSAADETQSVSSASTDATDTTLSSVATDSSTSASSVSSVTTPTSASVSTASDSVPASPATTVQVNTSSPAAAAPAAATVQVNTAESPKDRPRQWCYISDTTVRPCPFEEVLKAKAYICFYERMPAP